MDDFTSTVSAAAAYERAHADLPDIPDLSHTHTWGVVYSTGEYMCLTCGRYAEDDPYDEDYPADWPPDPDDSDS